MLQEECLLFFWGVISVWISLADQPFQMERSQTAQYLRGAVERFEKKSTKNKVFGLLLVQKDCLSLRVDR